MHRSQGIVLRTFLPQKQKIILFDAILGKIDAVPDRSNYNRCVQAGLIEYTAQPWQSLYRLHDIDLIAFPAAWVIHDILFLHHLLELACYFMRTHEHEKLFGFFHTLYQTESLDYLQKKLFLCRFFALLGIVPDELPDQELFSLICDDSRTMLKDQHTLDEKMTRWLYACVQTYAPLQGLRTLNFLNEKKVIA